MKSQPTSHLPKKKNIHHIAKPPFFSKSSTNRVPQNQINNGKENQNSVASNTDLGVTVNENWVITEIKIELFLRREGAQQFNTSLRTTKNIPVVCRQEPLPNNVRLCCEVKRGGHQREPTCVSWTGQ